MRPSLVNGLALIAAAATISLACSSADGRAHPDTVAMSGGAASPSATAAPAQATDALSKAADASRIQGSPTAPIWLIEVSDFQCPYCKMWHDESYQMVLNDYVKTGKVRMAYVNFPLSMHQHAHEAAVAAMCVGAQGKFWQMHDALFATQHDWEAKPSATATFDSLAKSVGANEAAYQSCLKSPSIEALVNGDQDRASRGGVNSTPSFFLDGHLIEGAVPRAEMKAEIERALAAHAASSGAKPGATSGAPSGTTSGTTSSAAPSAGTTAGTTSGKP
jgi:protein-disulfide isomerase